jgi:hypothetical protein
MENNGEQTQENTNEATMSEVQPSDSVAGASAAIDPMATINSSPDAPATIDSEVVKEEVGFQLK